MATKRRRVKFQGPACHRPSHVVAGLGLVPGEVQGGAQGLENEWGGRRGDSDCAGKRKNKMQGQSEGAKAYCMCCLCLVWFVGGGDLCYPARGGAGEPVQGGKLGKPEGGTPQWSDYGGDSERGGWVSLTRGAAGKGSPSLSPGREACVTRPLPFLGPAGCLKN